MLGNKSDLIVDSIGLYCPIPIFKAREGVDKIKPGEILELLADDPAAVEDIKYFAKTNGQELIKIGEDDGIFHFFIRKIK
jgi:TusA-related sulfurtransferase